MGQWRYRSQAEGAWEDILEATHKREQRNYCLDVVAMRTNETEAKTDGSTSMQASTGISPLYGG